MTAMTGMTAVRRVPALAAALLLCACAAPRQRMPPEPAAWVANAPCESSTAQLSADVIDPAKEILWQGEFRHAAVCLAESGSAQPVILLALGDGHALTEIDLHLHLGQDYLLGARVEVLDRAFHPLQSHRFDDFTQRSHHFSLRLFLPLDIEPAAYLLLRVDPDASNSHLDLVTGQRFATMWMAGGYMGHYADGTESRRVIAIRDTGRISLHRTSAAPRRDAGRQDE